MLFWLGTHQVHWLRLTNVPLFLSHRRLMKRRSFPRALGSWALDSGGFSELSMYGEWRTTPKRYAIHTRLWRDYIGRMEWAAIQDWMCEPFITTKTGLSVERHQYNTIKSYIDLYTLAPEVPWVPVLQGWKLEDYKHHVEMYLREGIDLRKFPLVGLGSVCRRQNTKMVEGLVKHLTAYGIKLHGFGFKLGGLRKVASYLKSSDSLAWSFGARRERISTLNCKHPGSCANCLVYALNWRDRILESCTSSL